MVIQVKKESTISFQFQIQLRMSIILNKQQVSLKIKLIDLISFILRVDIQHDLIVKYKLVACLKIWTQLTMSIIACNFQMKFIIKLQLDRIKRRAVLQISYQLEIVIEIEN